MADREHALAPRLRPAHGPAGLAGEPADEDVLGRERLGAEAAADVARDHPHLGRLEPERAREPVAVRVRRLGREPDVEAAVLVDERGGRARLERRRRHPLADDAPRGDDLAALEHVLVRSDGDVRADVRADLREEQRLAAQRLRRVDERRQRVVLDEDELGGVDARGRAVGEHDRDDLAGEADDVVARPAACAMRVSIPGKCGASGSMPTSAAMSTRASSAMPASSMLVSMPSMRALGNGERTKVT